MISERRRGWLLYALSAVLLLGGAVWYFRSAPTAGSADPRVAGWRDAAARLLPDRPSQVRADTVVMTPSASTDRTESVRGGSYRLTMVCLGESGRIRVRLSSSGDDSGRGVLCSEAPTPVEITVGPVAEFFLRISAEIEGSVAVFRWRLDPANGF